MTVKDSLLAGEPLPATVGSAVTVDGPPTDPLTVTSGRRVAGPAGHARGRRPRQSTSPRASRSPTRRSRPRRPPPRPRPPRRRRPPPRRPRPRRRPPPRPPPRRPRPAPRPPLRGHGHARAGHGDQARRSLVRRAPRSATTRSGSWFAARRATGRLPPLGRRPGDGRAPVRHARGERARRLRRRRRRPRPRRRAPGRLRGAGGGAGFTLRDGIGDDGTSTTQADRVQRRRQDRVHRRHRRVRRRDDRAARPGMGARVRDALARRRADLGRARRPTATGAC